MDSTINAPISLKPAMTSEQIAEMKAEWKREQEEKYREAERARKRAVIEKSLGGEVPYRDYTFDKFDPNLNGTHAILKACLSFDPMKDNLFMYGGQGKGKTHLSSAIARRVLDFGGTGHVFRGSELAAALKGRRTYATDHDQVDAISDLANIHVLVMDDVENGPNDKKGYLEAVTVLLEHRKNRGRFGCIITSNKTIAELADIIGPKICDRMQEFKHLVIPESIPSARPLLKRKK